MCRLPVFYWIWVAVVYLMLTNMNRMAGEIGTLSWDKAEIRVAIGHRIPAA